MVIRLDAGLSISYMMTQLSSDPVATMLLSGDQARQFMRAVWYNMFLSFTCTKMWRVKNKAPQSSKLKKTK
jgi:hypothetical protein